MDIILSLSYYQKNPLVLGFDIRGSKTSGFYYKQLLASLNKSSKYNIY